MNPVYTPSPPYSLRSILISFYLCLGLPSGLFSGSPTKCLCAFLSFPMTRQCDMWQCRGYIGLFYVWICSRKKTTGLISEDPSLVGNHHTVSQPGEHDPHFHLKPQGPPLSGSFLVVFPTLRSTCWTEVKRHLTKLTSFMFHLRGLSVRERKGKDADVNPPGRCGLRGTFCIYVSYDSHNKQRLFPQTALTSWSL
jgi:hypothetical protein